MNVTIFDTFFFSKQEEPGEQPMNQPPTRTIVAALDMSKSFDTVNIHTLL